MVSSERVSEQMDLNGVSYEFLYSEFSLAEQITEHALNINAVSDAGNLIGHQMCWQSEFLCITSKFEKFCAKELHNQPVEHPQIQQTKNWLIN